LGCEGSFGWCSVNKLIRHKEAKWATGQPDNKTNAENCVSINLSKESALLMDSDCGRKLNYVCEARDTTKVNTNSEAMMDECGAAFNVSRGIIFPYL